ncbi:MAG: carbohydrate kinase [Bacteroidetes bacterium GWF2_42_66]|nr:MAG: carbohydrate kinase [Bacteroidetes bacterium GWA2_42_15]OFX97266.1 MAG: carbohydrate kinase [Bacteroidetes bacterium GWE2_42_39]OFY39903.1 MAG: carbohydrate kinase [Bacteroidetes bacterium GWF2_42_66]HBL78083.1 carbohydrate kinase [Prolixibacteraceae bacterium]HCR91972.1 carbohydrate kinase [Prolixibacteraceae bacterium]
MKKKVIAVFDIGKTNKKILLFDQDLKVAFQKEEKFPTIQDDDGFECDDIDLIRQWLVATMEELVAGEEFEPVAVNFSTYGASLAYLDGNKDLLTPIYNYLKPMDEQISGELYQKYGGQNEFCRKTAGPALGMLNSGLQILWLKKEKPEIFSRVKNILHFPQYLSSVFTGEVVSEYTSIGCHTAMWNFDNRKYHLWLAGENIVLPGPVSNSTVFEVEIAGNKLLSGIGIHDSSASLVPYFMGTDEKFLLVSTGTWCINMNPFNDEPLTAEQLKSDCLCYLSVQQKPVKASRLFMGHIHDVNVTRLATYFNVADDAYKKVKADETLITAYLTNGEKRVFFRNGMSADYVDTEVDLSVFSSFEEAYTRMMYDLTLLCTESIRLIIPKNDEAKKLFVSGGFARNGIFVRLLGNFFPGKEVFTSEVDNSSAMGAALVIWDTIDEEKPEIDLGLKAWNPF